MLVAKRLEGQMQRMSEAESGAGEGEKERELAKAALSVAELGMSRMEPVIVPNLGTDRSQTVYCTLQRLRRTMS